MIDLEEHGVHALPIVMDNSSGGKLLVPGFNNIALTFELPIEKRFTHGVHEYAQVPAITARELAMTTTMDWITDQPSWTTALIDNDELAITSWKVRAFACQALMSENAWSWCLEELRDKAVEQQEKGFVRVLDTGACVCKTDTLVEETVCADLRDTFRASHAIDNPVPIEISLINPYLNPLVYGETRTLAHGTIGLPTNASSMEEIMLSVEQTTTSARHPAFDTLDVAAMSELLESTADTRMKGYWWFENSGMKPDQFFWSSKYQCLPCDVKFGKSQTKVEIASYINDLHPSDRRAYMAIEKIMTASIKLWNECLIRGRATRYDEAGCSIAGDQYQRGRHPLRILTFGVQWSDTLPAWARSFMLQHNEDVHEYLRYKYAIESDASQLSAYARETLLAALGQRTYLEGVPMASAPTAEDWSLAEEYLGCTLNRDIDRAQLEGLLQAQADRRRYWTHPDASTKFSYEDWKLGRDIDKAITNMVVQPLCYLPPDSTLPTAPTTGAALPDWSPHCKLERPLHERYDIDLEQSFKDHGLQMIVRADSIWIDSEKDFSGDWRLEGHLNEHIVAVAIYMFDAVNVDVQIAFAQEVSMNPGVYRWRGEFQQRCTQDDLSTYHYDPLDSFKDLDALAQTFGLRDADAITWEEGLGNHELPVQQIGTMQLPQGRLITFPNVLEHRIQASLIDPAWTTGHARYLTLYLCDPHYRLCSTANVPPQQEDWWKMSVGNILAQKGLPHELVDQIFQYYKPPMTSSRAQQCAQEMQEEARWLQAARHAAMESFMFERYI